MMGTTRGAPGETPHCKSTTISAYRDAVLQLGGDAALSSVLGLLPEPTRRVTAPGQALPARIPVSFVVDWCTAIWEGPARRDRERYNEHLHAQVRLGFGRIQSVLLRMVNARRLIERSPSLWEVQHSHGTLEIVHLEETAAVLSLANHLYVETPQARATVAEIFRYLISMTGERNVRASHARESEALVVRLNW
jgi:hypothetical protein